MCEIGVGRIFENPLATGHGNGSEWGEEKHCAFAEQNIYFSFSFIILYSLFIFCIELNFRITKS